MKKLVLIFTLSFVVGYAFAQEIDETLDKKTQKKYEKQEKKKQKEEEAEKAKEELNEMIDNRSFVLEANNLSGRSGAQVPVVPSLNFFAIDSSTAVLQIGSVSGIGYNGVGGVTDEARVTRYEKTETKGGYSVKIYATSHLTSYTIFLSASPLGTSTARVTGLSGGVINFHGKIVPMSESIVYKGITSY